MNTLLWDRYGLASSGLERVTPIMGFRVQFPQVINIIWMRNQCGDSKPTLVLQ